MSLTTSFQRHSASQSLLTSKNSMPFKQSCLELLVKIDRRISDFPVSWWDPHRSGCSRAVSSLAVLADQLLSSIVRQHQPVAFLWNSSNPANALHFEEVQRGAAVFGISLISVPAATPEAIGSALTTMIGKRPEALLMTADPM